ncbi:O-antigen ligase family protein [Patescibacteria group bacterium]|nr:O-antigen ligase family protein [Patescibacteria group bacterium]
MKILNNLIKYGLCLFVFLLPWQTRWIFKDAAINGQVWEYGRWSLYGTEVLLIILLLLALTRFFISPEFKFQIPNSPSASSGPVGKLQINSKSKIQNPKQFSKLLFWSIVILVIWSTLTISWSLDKGLAWYGWLKLAEGVALFWLITNQSQTTRTIANQSRIFLKTFSHALIASGVAQALLGISQFMRQTNISANKWLGMSWLDPTETGASVIEFLDMRWLRAYGSLPHPNILAGFLVICLLLVIINLWRHDHKVTNIKEVGARRGAHLLNSFYWLSAVIIFLGLLVTFSRGAWLAFIICFASGFIYWLVKKSRIIIKLNITLLIIFCLTFAFVWVSYPTQLFTTRFNPEARLEKKSMEQRTAGYQQALILLKENSVLGLGINNYTLALYQKDSRWPGYAYQPVHDAGLLTLVELGIPSLLLFVMIIISALKKKSEYILLLLAILILGLFDHYLRSFYFGIMLWWLVLAMNAVFIKER